MAEGWGVVERNLWLSLPDAFAAMVSARAGFDSVTLDMQHGLFDERAVVAVLMALGAARPRRLVRVPAVEMGVVGKVLDAGADGVIAPLVNCVGDARRLVAACRYPPLGARSFGPMLAGIRAGGRDYAEVAGEVEVWAMIETAAGLDAVEAIAGVEGVSGLFVGPNDLAIALGLGAGSDREEPVVLAAFARVVAAARGAGKRAGLFCGGGAYARRIAPLGFDFLTVISDTAALQAGLAGALAAMGDAVS